MIEIKRLYREHRVTWFCVEYSTVNWNSSINEWLKNINGGRYCFEIDWEKILSKENISYYIWFEREEDAMLFKLTWC